MKNSNPPLQFLQALGYVLLYVFSFPTLMFLLLAFVLFNAVTLTGEYGATIWKSFITYGLVSILFSAYIGFQFYRTKLDKLKAWKGVLSTGVFIVTSIILFVLFYSTIGVLGDNAPVNHNEEFYNDNFAYSILQPLIIALFEAIIFSGTAGVMFWAVLKLVPKDLQSYAVFWIIILLGGIFMIYHVLTQDWNWISLMITWFVGSFFAGLVWIDELSIFHGKDYFVYTWPIRIAMHFMIDMFQLGLMSNVAFKVLGWG